LTKTIQEEALNKKNHLILSVELTIRHCITPEESWNPIKKLLKTLPTPKEQGFGTNSSTKTMITVEVFLMSPNPL
jgi:hypothetical protein